MPYLTQLIEGYHRFREHDWSHERERWSELADGQSPKVMILSCADSRVDPAQIFDARPGEMFVVRNIAALAPTPELLDADRVWVRNMWDALTPYSSNIGAVKIGMQLGADRFDQWVRRFGFGKPTGVDLPGEEQGIVLPRDKYSGSSMGNLPIGQGESVTPLQIATAYAAIANGGILRRPHIVRAVNGRPLQLPAGRRVISPRVATELRHMLEGVLARFGRTYTGEPDVIAQELAADAAVRAADTLLLTVPNQLGVEYNAHLLKTIAEHVAPAIGWIPAGAR